MPRSAQSRTEVPAIRSGRCGRAGSQSGETRHDEDRGTFVAVRRPRWRNIDFSEAAGLELCCCGLSDLGRCDRGQPHVSLYPLRTPKALGDENEAAGLEMTQTSLRQLRGTTERERLAVGVADDVAARNGLGAP